MVIVSRRQGSDGAIWKVVSHRPVRVCPECETENSMRYIGFAKNYEHGMQAKLYQCNECNTWVDCMWSEAVSRLIVQYGKSLENEETPPVVRT